MIRRVSETGAVKETQLGRRAYEDLWLAIGRRRWRSVAIVPAGRSASTASLAAALTEAGTRLGDPVVSIAAPALDRDPAAVRESLRQAGGAGRVVVSVPAVVDDPRALAVARAADLVVVTIERGRTAHADARRTVELVGRDRVAGCLLVG